MSYPPQPPQQQYQQPYQQPYAQVQPKTSGLAITGFVMTLVAVVLTLTPLSLIGWLLNLAGFIISIVANSQVKKSNGLQTGKGLAVAGIVISSVWFGLWLILGIFIGAAVLSVFGAMGGL